jgi:Tfp pilus assembly protein PilF
MEVMKGIDLGVPSSSDSNIDEQVEMLVRVYSALGDQCYLRRDYPKARENYMAALQHDPSAITTWAKFTILRLGRLGIRIRDLASSI